MNSLRDVAQDSIVRSIFQGVKRTLTLGVALLIVFALVLPAGSWPQSGRRRPTRRRPPPTETKKPPTKPPEKPSPTRPSAPIPPGGEIKKRELDPRTATSRFALSNGLTLIVREKYALPLVAITAVVRAGRQDEPASARGVAELVARLLWQGTTARPGSQAARALRALGAVIQTRTASEYTSYRLVLSPEKATSAIEILADILQHPLFEPEVVQRQARLMQKERQSEFAAPSVWAQAALVELILRDRLADRALGGGEVRSITRDQVLDFYRSRYRPENVVISIVGAISPFAVLETIQRAYGGWPVRPGLERGDEERGEKPHQMPSTAQKSKSSGEAREAAAGEQPAREQLRYAQRIAEIDPALLNIGYWFDEVRTADRPALDVLAAVLMTGRGARLRWALQETNPLVREIFMRRIEFGNRELWTFQLRVPPDNLNQAEIVFFEAIQRLRREILSPGELQRAQALLEHAFYDRRARLEQEAEDLAVAEATVGDYREADRVLERMRAVTAEQVRRAAARYLTLSRTTVYEVLPRRVAAQGVTGETFAQWIASKVPGLDEAISAARAKRAPAVPLIRQGQRRRPGEELEAVIFSPQPEPIRNYSVLHGARAYVRVDQSRPTIAMGLFFHGGRLFEDATNYGITELMLRTMWRGVKSHWDYQTGEELKRGQEVTLPAGQVIMKLEQLGGELQWVNEPDFFGFILHVLSRNQDQALQLLVDIVERPLFDEAEVERARAELLYELRHRSPRPVDLAWRALVGEHSYSVPPWGRVETVEQLTPERLRDWHRQTIGRQYPLVIVVGDTDGSTLISTIIARQFHRREIQRTFRARIPQLQPAPRQQTATSRMPALAIGFLVPAHQVVEREIFDVIEQILVGPGGRLTASLSDRHGWAYRVGARFDPRALASAFFVWMTPSATDEAEVLAEVQRHLQWLVAGPIEEEMVTLGINAAIGAQRDRLQAHPARVLAYARHVFLGERPVDVEHYAERLHQLTGQKIHAVATQYLKWERRGIGRLRSPSRSPATPQSPVTASEKPRPSSVAFQ